MSNYISGTYGLKYVAEWQNFRKQIFRIEVHEKGFTGTSKTMGHFQNALLEIQGDEGNPTSPIVKTQLRFMLVDSWDEADTPTTKYGGWEEFYTPDSTRFLVILKSWRNNAWVTRWSGYITPDSWSENLEYRGSITITARDNIGHLQDFPFDLTGDGWGLVSLRSVITAAMQKISLPMNFETSDAGLDTLDGDGTMLLDGKVCVSTFKGSSWQAALEDILEATGYTLRWTDFNRVTLAPIRHLPLMGEDSYQHQEQQSPLEFYGGSRTLDPAYKQIVDTLHYDGDDSANLDVKAGISFSGTRQDYTIQYQYTGTVAFDTGWSYQNAGSSDGYGWQAGYGFLDGDATDLSVGMLQEEGEDAATIGAILCANQSGAGFVQTYKTRVLSPAATLRIDFAALVRGLRPTGETDNMIAPLHVALSAVRVYIRYEVGSSERYWNGNAWVSSAVYVDRTLDDTEGQSGYSVEFALGPCDLADGGDLYIAFDRIASGALTVDDTPARGIYARVLGISLSSNAPRLESDKVTTINNAEYNVTLDRTPALGALSREVAVISPANYPNALFHVKNGVLKAFPYAVSWGSGATKPLPVMIHQQILMFHHTTLSILSGDCAPSGNNMPYFDAVWNYKNRNLIIQSGTWDMGTGIVNGANLRGYIDYDDLWDDTGADYSGSSEYDTDAYKDRPVSQPASSGGGGGGGGSVNAVKVNGSTYNPNSSGLVTLPNYPTMLRNPNALILAETVNGTPIKTYNGESEVTFTKADLQAVLGGGTGSGTVTSVGMTVPTGLSVSGSPITSSGTLALSYASGFSIPKTLDTAKGVTAYGWGDHSQEGYLKADDLGGLGLSAPVLQIYRGVNSEGEIFAPFLKATHPLMGDSRFDAVFVLMMWSPRRGRKRDPNEPESSKYRRGWGEARGEVATSSPLTFSLISDHHSADKPLSSIRLHILHNYVCGRGQSLATVHSMNWQTFVQSGQDGYDYGFGGLNNYSGTSAEFYAKVSRSRMFGIAVRVSNPAFDELVSGSLVETTRRIGGTPRYLYSAVTPFRVIIGNDQSGNTTMGFQMQPICAPTR